MINSMFSTNSADWMNWKLIPDLEREKLENAFISGNAANVRGNTISKFGIIGFLFFTAEKNCYGHDLL